MIALAGYQFALYRRNRFWLLPLVGWLAFLLAFYLRVSDPHPGSYGRGSEAVFVLGLGLAWTLCLTQDPALWQITLVAAGSRERAQLSRVLLCWLLLVPATVLAALVTASHRLGDAHPLPALVAGLLGYLMLALIGCALGVAAGARTGPRLLAPVLIFVVLCWLVVLS